jgi:DTW domain-containing protein YfiP
MAVCVCAEVTPQPTRLRVVVLQHPQEPDVLLGSAKLATLGLERGALRVGLSWPNLSKAVGEAAEPSRWAVVHLGGKESSRAIVAEPGKSIALVDRHGGGEVDASKLDGVIVLDGTWSQAKTLWWRNAWLLKLNRVVLFPKRPSAYGKLRREPRRECLSTLEAIGLTLTELGEAPEIEASLLASFGRQLAAVKASGLYKGEAPRRPRPRGPKKPGAQGATPKAPPAKPAPAGE